MRRWIEWLICAVCAVGVHLSVFLQVDSGAAPSAGGVVAAGGFVAAADGALASLVESWAAEPDHATVADTPAEPDADRPPQAMAALSVPDVSTADPVAAPPPPPDNAVAPELATVVPASTGTPPAPPTPPAATQPVSPAVASDAIPMPPAAQALSPPAEPTRPAPQPRIEDLEIDPATTAAPVAAVLPMAKPAGRIPVRQARSRSRAETPARAPQQPRSQPQAQPSSAPQVTTSTPPPGTQNGTLDTGTEGVQATAAQEGAGESAQTASYSPAAVASAQRTYVAAVRSAVMRQRAYPRRAERRGITGRAVVRLRLSADGQLLRAALVASSGVAMLDDATMAAVRAVERYPAIPTEMQRSAATVDISIRFDRR